MNIFKIIFYIFEWFFNFLISIIYGFKIFFRALIYQMDAENRLNEGEHVDNRMIDDELFNEEYGLLKNDELIRRKAKRFVNFDCDSPTEQNLQTPEERESSNEAIRQKDPLKAQGDHYETLIGKQFEKKGNLVIYNGFIHGRDDQGVDIIAISSQQKTVNLVQCKNWLKRQITITEIKKIHLKLNSYHPTYVLMDCAAINFYLTNKKTTKDILSLLHTSKKYSIRKTLYLSSDKVIDLSVGEHLKMMGSNIFKYKDMKIVVKDII